MIGRDFPRDCEAPVALRAMADVPARHNFVSA